MRSATGIGMVAALVASFWAMPVAAGEKQIRPFIGVTFAGDTTLFNPGSAASKPHATIGVSALVLGEIFGVEADVAHTPGFFQSGNSGLVLSSSVTTVTGNLMVAVPHRLTEYALRPYLVGGAGLMRVQREDSLDVFNISNVYAATDVGGGATGFITNRVGVSWEARYFRAIGRKSQTVGNTSGTDELSFWRASMAIAIRY